MPNIPARRPNILLLFADQHHARFMGCAGHPELATPALDALAAGGVRFDRAYCQDGICVPSRNSIFTGFYPRTLGLLDNESPPQPPTAPALQRVLREAGYFTFTAGKRHLLPELDTDWDEAYGHLPNEGSGNYFEWIRSRGLWDEFEHDFEVEFGSSAPGKRSMPMMCGLSRLPDDATMEAFTEQKTIAFLRRMRGSDQPFFCWSSFYRPHQPYTPLPSYAARIDQAKVRLPDSLRQPIEQLPPGLQAWRRGTTGAPWFLAHEGLVDDALHRMHIAYYQALVMEIDDRIASIMRALRELGLADDTIVVYTADHGEFVGAHGLIEKLAWQHNVYEDTLRVPFIINWPGRICSGETRSDLVELVDLFPTLLDFAGVGADARRAVPGRSLRPTLLHGEPTGRRYAMSENRSQAAVIGERYKLGTWLPCPVEELDYRAFGDMLFDRVADPLEIDNLGRDPARKEIARELGHAYAEWSRVTPARHAPAKVNEF